MSLNSIIHVCLCRGGMDWWKLCCAIWPNKFVTNMIKMRVHFYYYIFFFWEKNADIQMLLNAGRGDSDRAWETCFCLHCILLCGILLCWNSYFFLFLWKMNELNIVMLDWEIKTWRLAMAPLEVIHLHVVGSAAMQPLRAALSHQHIYTFLQFAHQHRDFICLLM